MRSRGTRNGPGIVGCVVIATALAACGGPDGGPEAAIHAWVERGEAAAESKDRGDLVDMISPAYADARGHSREDLENLMRIYFLRESRVALITRIDELNVIGDSAAELVLQVGMAGTDGGVLDFDADAYRFEMELVLEDDDWLLISARWGGLGDEVL